MNYYILKLLEEGQYVPKIDQYLLYAAFTTISGSTVASTVEKFGEDLQDYNHLRPPDMDRFESRHVSQVLNYRPNRGRCSRWNIGRRPKWQQCVEAVHWTCARGSSGWTGHSKTSTVPSPGLALGECPGRTVPLQPRSPNQDEFAMESAHGRSRIDGGMCGSHICIVEGCPS